MKVDTSFISLGQFIIDQEKLFPQADGHFSQILRDIVIASKFIHREVNRAGLADILGNIGADNVHGESVKKLDVYANEHLKKSLMRGGVASIIASEEEVDIVLLNDREGKYVVLFDPLDGSSNIDVNIPVGTIFSIYRRTSDFNHGCISDCLQTGRQQLAAGYVIYGSSTILTYTTGNGVNIFTFDPGIGDFFLSQAQVRIPQEASYLSVNDMKFDDFLPHTQSYINAVRQRNITNDKPLTPRYVGSLVADFHRNLLKGGIFMYPGTNKNPNGKLRLLYEANPMAFIIEQAGGKATDGHVSILDIQPTELHQRVPLILGSINEVNRYLSFVPQPELANL
jgi:fructose-1,6-bisphosphatase I